ncbi:unnamed protein product [Effrenium voratum]|uniref:Uncharacterized protein n=1 Tax=Effrenium voratum TaxID=2562239 RepID=A0AA36HN34_9DINO|nr:unnamed protein product [Effrenium voratum]
MEVVIQLKGGANLSTHSQDEILRAVQDEYFNRYLHQLGIAPTAANKAQMMKFRPMDDCEVHGVWADDASGLAAAIRIAPPLRHRVGYEDSDEPLDKAIISHLYGEAEDIPVEPPNVPGRTIFPVDLEKMFPPEERVRAEDILAEVRKARSDHMERQKRRANPAAGSYAHGASLDSDQQQRYRQELEMLKSKYILPYACERPVQEGSKRTQLVPWAPEGPLELRLRAAEVAEPLAVEIEQIQVQLKAWVQNQLPLELLSSRARDAPQLLEELRGALWENEVCQLIGLLAHLLYWLAFGCCRSPGLPRLGQHALQGLVAAAHEIWVKLERRHKNSKLGISLGMPCVLLTLKYGMEICFESQYPSLFGEKTGEWSMREALVERINTLLMRLFDPDCTYARFGRLDAADNPFNLYKRLDLLASANSPNRRRLKQMQGRANRATPLVRAALQAGQDGKGGVGTENPKTRSLLVHSELGGRAPLASVVAPSGDERYRDKLLRAANSRIGTELPHLPQVKARDRRGPGSQSAR